MVGATVATISAILVALAGDTPIKALYALIALLILQQIDGNIIVPKVVGKNVNLHPQFCNAIFVYVWILIWNNRYDCCCSYYCID